MPKPTITVGGTRTAFEHDRRLNASWWSAKSAFLDYMSNPLPTRLYSPQKGLFLLRLVLI